MPPQIEPTEAERMVIPEVMGWRDWGDVGKKNAGFQLEEINSRISLCVVSRVDIE